jgi:hypothetical protein
MKGGVESVMRPVCENAATLRSGGRESNNAIVMAGLVPAIHVFAALKKGVDARHKAGHDRN